MTRIRMTTYWIVSDCDLENVSVYICTWLDAYVCEILGQNSFKGGRM